MKNQSLLIDEGVNTNNSSWKQHVKCALFIFRHAEGFQAKSGNKQQLF